MAKSIKELINSLNHKSENEIIELKEAKGDSFKTKDIGCYFSALSNEANLKGKENGFLIFGVQNDGAICGTSYRLEASIPSKGLNRLKKEIAEVTNNRITFRNISEEIIDGKRVIVFDIPAATRGIPTQWAGAAWAREGESLVPLPMNKIDEIRLQPPHDWSRQIVEGATIEDLDQRAIQFVRDKFREKYGDREGLLEALDDIELLDKAGITYRGQITNTALLLVGKSEASNLIIGALPKITWTLYESSEEPRAYQHFNPPFVIAVDELLAKIRNEERTIMLQKDSIIPNFMSEYDSWSLRELIGNSIAHQAYDMGGKINIEEFPDKVVFLNEGMFIPGNLETALGAGYKPPYYRNPFLADAMLQIGMLDQNSMGILRICKNSQARSMPLPTYFLDDPQRVRVELLNHEIDSRYTHILSDNPDLPILTVLALDKVQKGFLLTPYENEVLINYGFIKVHDDRVELVDPSLNANKVVDPNYQSEDREENGIVVRHRKHLPVGSLKFIQSEIIKQIGEGPISRNELDLRLRDVYIGIDPDLENYETKGQTYRLLKKLESEHIIEKRGNTRAARWYLIRDNML